MAVDIRFLWEQRKTTQADLRLIWKYHPRPENVPLCSRSYNPSNDSKQSRLDEFVPFMVTNEIPSPFVSTKWILQKASAIYVMKAVTQGVNFLTINDGIASLNHDEHTALGLEYNEARKVDPASMEPYNFDDFYTNNIFGFPGNEQLMRLFLEHR